MFLAYKKPYVMHYQCMPAAVGKNVQLKHLNLFQCNRSKHARTEPS